jgi:hypothetical protein
MIFLVSNKCKGSLSLNSLSAIVKSGNKISIESSKILCPDVQAAIASKVLVPVDEKEYRSKYKGILPDVIVVNKTNKIMVLGDKVLKPLSSINTSQDFANSLDVVQAKKRGLIDIVSKKADIKDALSKTEEPQQVVSDPEEKVVLRGEDRPVKPQAWDFREKKVVDAVPVPKAEDVIFVDADAGKKPKKAASSLKKKKDKKGKRGKIQKGKAIQPVGEARPEKTSAEAILDTDTQNRPGQKVAEVIEDIVRKISGEDISFVDAEQEQERIKDRKRVE